MKVISPFVVNDANLLASNVPEDDYPIYDPAAIYAIGANLIYIAENTHWVIRSRVDNNQGNIPTGLASDTNWVKVSETNRWKMFDLKSTSQTVGSFATSVGDGGTLFDDAIFDSLIFDAEVSSSNGIDVTVSATGITNAAYVGNVQGSRLQLTGYDVNDNLIYSSNVSLISTDGIVDAYSYFFSPLVFKRELVFTDLPPYGLCSYQLVITSASECRCGTFLLGFMREPGASRYGMAISIQDYSIKQANEFGDFVITERAYSKRLDLSAYVAKPKTDAFIDFLNTFRAKPLVWVGADQYEGSVVYGFYKDYNAVVSYPTETLFSLQIEGLS
jgi:hypothetical protein